MSVRILVIAFFATALAWSLLTRTSDGARPAQVYVVQTGDTLWSIAAEHYGGDPRAAVWRLQKRNDLADATIVPGERLVLP